MFFTCANRHSCPSPPPRPSTLRHKSVPPPVQQTGEWTLLSIGFGSSDQKGRWTLLSIAAGPPSTLRHKSVPPPIQQTGGWTLLSIAASPAIDTAAQECTDSYPANRRMDTLVHRNRPHHQHCGTKVYRLLSSRQEDGHSCPSQPAPPLTLRHKSVPPPVQQETPVSSYTNTAALPLLAM